jgi:hypothetical protein
VLPQVAFLNGPAIEIALRYEVHACTDITGFALAGHALEMARGSGLMIEIDFSALPIHPNVLEMYAKGETTGSNTANRKLVAGKLDLAAKLSATQEELLFDPQTSGGLLLAVAADQADSLLRELSGSRHRANGHHRPDPGQRPCGDPGGLNPLAPGWRWQWRLIEGQPLLSHLHFDSSAGINQSCRAGQTPE